MTPPRKKLQHADKCEALAKFGMAVLEILEAHHDWGADTFDAIDAAAARAGLQERDSARFRIDRRYRGFQP